MGEKQLTTAGQALEQTNILQNILCASLHLIITSLFSIPELNNSEMLPILLLTNFAMFTRKSFTLSTRLLQ